MQSIRVDDNMELIPIAPQPTYRTASGNQSNGLEVDFGWFEWQGEEYGYDVAKPELETACPYPNCDGLGCKDGIWHWVIDHEH